MTQIFGGMPPFSPRSNSQSGSYFDQAVEALRASGDPNVLWADADDFHRGSPIFEQPQRQADALQRRLWLLRSSVLFAAVCAEAYANEFSAEVLSASDAKTLDRLPTVDKILLSPRLGGKESSVERGSEPVQTIQTLFKVRDALVHPRRSSPAAYVRYATDQDEALVGPRPAGRYLIAVATLMDAFDALRPPPAVLFQPGRLVAKHPSVLELHLDEVGRTIGDLPEEHAARPVGLQVLASRAEAAAARRNRTP